MRIDNLSPSISCSRDNAFASARPSPLLNSTLQTMEQGSVKKELRLVVLLEDIISFFINLLFFPVLGLELLINQILFILLYPILLPFIVFEEFMKSLIHLFTCGCAKTILTPSFDLTPPSVTEKTILSNFVQAHGNPDLDHGHQIRLAHIMSRYLDYAKRYADEGGYGSRYIRFQALIKVTIDGQSEFFQFCPSDRKDKVLQDYLQQVRRQLTPNSHVKHEFIGIDHQYMLGLLKMELKTDIVDYDCKTEVEQSIGICGHLFNIFAPKIGKHMRKAKDEIEHFSLWPRDTRNAICARINRQLASHDLDGTHISFLDLDRLIRG